MSRSKQEGLRAKILKVVDRFQQKKKHQGTQPYTPIKISEKGTFVYETHAIIHIC